MVLVSDWHAVLLAVLVLHGIFGAEVIKICRDLDVFGSGLVLLDLHYFLHGALDVESLGVHTEAPVPNLCVPEYVLHIEHE